MSVADQLRISRCTTHHVNAQGDAIYLERFDEVLSFHHEAGQLLAAVNKANSAWHIGPDGSPAYEPRFDRCFGFYCGCAAVISDDGWYHINPDGSPLYPERYEFCGNFQDEAAVVVDSENRYFHINLKGAPLAPRNWKYCGDFRNGIAVVQSSDGLSTHIYKDGTFVHGQWFSDLDVFHKNYARAKTTSGWRHIDREGRPIYESCFAEIEPFYNGFARCERHDGGLVVINEAGKIVRELRTAKGNTFSDLSSDMVGYWRTFAISTAVELGVFEALPNSSEKLAEICACDNSKVQRLLAALQELQLVSQNNAIWAPTKKGAFLIKSNPKTLSDAALEYSGDLLQRWSHLPDIIRGKYDVPNIFTDVASCEERIGAHHRMLASYAMNDYEGLVRYMPVTKDMNVLDAAGGTGTLAKLMDNNYPGANIILGDLPEIVRHTDYSNIVELDLFSDWQLAVDRIMLARVLHDWSDDHVVRIFNHAKNALNSGGLIWVIEMLLEDNSSSGALCDLHLLSVNGGQERTLLTYEKLATKAGLKLQSCQKSSSLVSLLSFAV